MAKIIKNTTNATIFISEIGTNIAANSSLTIDPSVYYIWAKPEMLAEISSKIDSGQLVVNDGVLDLTVANNISLDRAKDFLKHPDTAFNVRFLAETERSNGFFSKNVQEAIEEAKATIEGKISVLPTFLNNGLTANKWLALDGAMGGSDILPAVTSYDSKFAGLTYINTNDGSNVDIEFYKNGLGAPQLIFTWQIRNKRHAWKTNNLGAITFMKGDRISCFARGVTGTSARDVIVNVFVQSTNSTVGEGGGSTGIT
jgi:hypothetical protein